MSSCELMQRFREPLQMQNYTLSSVFPNPFLEINKKHKSQNTLEILKLHLDNCGNLAKRKYYCRQCEAEGNEESLLEVEKVYRECGIRYCARHKCIITRFAVLIEALKSIKRFQSLTSLWHFSIGFPLISLDDFSKNFRKEKLRQEYILNHYFSALRKRRLEINAIKTLDFTFKRGVDNKLSVYMHWHFVALPFKSSELRKNLLIMQETRKKVLKYQKHKKPFFLKSYGYKSKKTLFSYLALRSCGCYKRSDELEKNYKMKQIRHLKELLAAGKFVFLKNFVNLETYAKEFYKSHYFTKIGSEIDMPQRSTIMDSLSNLHYVSCKIHGRLCTSDRFLVRWGKLEFKPPGKPQDALKITQERIATPLSRVFCGSCFHEYEADDMHNKHLCLFCSNNQRDRIINKFNERFEDASS